MQLRLSTIIDHCVPWQLASSFETLGQLNLTNPKSLPLRCLVLGKRNSFGTCGVGLVRCCGGGQVQIMSSLMWRWCRRSHGTSDIFLIIWYECYSWERERERESWGSVLLRWMCWLWLIAHNIRYMLAS